MSSGKGLFTGRRRSPPNSSGQMAGKSQSLPPHPFLDLEMSETSTSDHKSLLNDWVPDKFVPTGLPPINTGTETLQQPTRKASKKSWWLLGILGLTGTVLVLWLLFGRSRLPKAAVKLTSLGSGENKEFFISVKGTQFMMDCRPFLVAGFNAHNVVPQVLATTSEHKMHENREGKDLVVAMFRNASSLGLNVARVYAHSTDADHPFLSKPGEYHKDALEALDFVLETCRELGIKVMLSFVDNWKFLGGADQMLEWSSTVKRRSQDRPEEKKGDFDDQDLPEKVKEYEVGRHSYFFNDTGAKNIYKNYVKTFVLRENSINGRIYKEDPTIMSWGLINEPRCETWRVPECKLTFQAWVEEMAAYVKSLDGTHLVTIGSEGFFGEASALNKHNPQSWGGQIGQDFVKNHMPSSIDYATMHYWPENWQRADRQYQEEWMKSHIDSAQKTLKKPLILEEFGKKLTEVKDPAKFKRIIAQERDPVFESSYQILEAALKSDRALRGSLFWRWDLIIYEDQARADYGVRLEDPTFSYIKSHASFSRKLQASRPPAATCEAECWVPSETAQTCTNIPEECTAQLKSKKKLGQRLTYPTKTACCRSGLGAFVEGCSK